MTRHSYLSQIVAYTGLVLSLSCGDKSSNSVHDDDPCLIKAKNGAVVDAFGTDSENSSIDPFTFCVGYASHIEGRLEKCLTSAYGEPQVCKIGRRDDGASVTTLEFAVVCSDNIEAMVSSYDNGFKYFCGPVTEVDQ